MALYDWKSKKSNERWLLHRRRVIPPAALLNRQPASKGSNISLQRFDEDYLSAQRLCQGL